MKSKYHPRQRVDTSGPTYRVLTKANPTDGTRWMVQVQPRISGWGPGVFVVADSLGVRADQRSQSLSKISIDIISIQAS